MVVEGKAGERFVLSTQHIAEIRVVLVQVAGVEEVQETAEEFLVVQPTTERGVLESLAGEGEDSEKKAMVSGCRVLKLSFHSFSLTSLWNPLDILASG